jgi:ABC-2 type transport system ATP-binding protein
MFKPVKTFSGGMKRKLEIVRSLMVEPKVLFLDEPTTGLDPLSRRQLWDYLKAVRQKHATTIFLTTHYLEEAEGAEYACIINKGKVVARGTPREIRQSLVNNYVEVDSGQREALLAELGQQPNGVTWPLRIPIADMTEAQRVIKEIKTPLTVLSVHTPTLEEAYVHIIGEDQV